ncbi:hypothetical protein G6F57_011601 [Rhizopus arrhizus]|nr:hypothetical protein G6F57_011601 [Rhizopus arrhizus]
MGGQGHPADLAVHLGVAGQHRAQVQGDRLAGFEHQAGAAAQAHGFPSFCRTTGIAAATAARPTLAMNAPWPSMAGCRGRYETFHLRKIPMSTHPRLSAEDASTLLDHLIGNDDFRNRFTASPAKALASIGLDGAVGENDCMKIGTLASVEELCRTRDSLHAYLSTSTASMTVVFCFEADRIDERVNA